MDLNDLIINRKQSRKKVRNDHVSTTRWGKIRTKTYYVIKKRIAKRKLERQNRKNGRK